MDVISLGKANKAKREIKKVQDRIGMNGTEQGLDIKDKYKDADERLTELEKRDPEVELLNRVGEVSENTAINLNKHNLHVRTLLNQRRYKHTDMIIDDFEDDSGIDTDKSSGYLHDEIERKVVLSEGKQQAEVVTVAEELSSPPQMIAISQASNENATANKEVNLEDGLYVDAKNDEGIVSLNVIGTSESGKNLYSKEGYYVSGVIDLGENAKTFSKVESKLDTPEGTDIKLYTATSQDGVNFSEYLPINSDGTIASPSARYVKIKAELYAASDTSESLIYGFTAKEKEEFEVNELIELDGSARLKTEFSSNMEVDTSFIEKGTLLRSVIDKSKLKIIENMEVK